jgi:hypothetical protein
MVFGKTLKTDALIHICTMVFLDVMPSGANILEEPALFIYRYSSFLKMKAAGLSEMILVYQTVALHPRRSDADQCLCTCKSILIGSGGE